MEMDMDMDMDMDTVIQKIQIKKAGEIFLKNNVIQDDDWNVTSCATVSVGLTKSCLKIYNFIIIN